MTKRKRTYEEVEAMQEKAVRFQEALDHWNAARRIEELTIEQYAALRKIEIVDEPIQKRRSRKQKEDRYVPPGYKRHIEVAESHEVIPGGTRTQKVIKTWLVPKSRKNPTKKKR
jgi:hypothetical protein